MRKGWRAYSGAASSENRDGWNLSERISAFTFLSTFYEDCFLLKTAIAVPLKKSNKRENTVFLRATAEQSRFFTGRKSI